MIPDEPLQGKNILITGGTGTLGRALVKAIRTNDWGVPKTITIFSRGEDEQKEMTQEFDYPLLRFVPGDVSCPGPKHSRIRYAEVIIHCAAMKDIPQCELWPHLAIKTNAIGASRFLHLAIFPPTAVQKFVLISSDKSIMPVSVYGCTKQLAERLAIQAAKHSGPDDPTISIVRLVNLWGSSGSVVPLFRRQIAAGGPITITDNRMMRWFMWPSDAAAFVLGTLRDARAGEIAIPPAYAMRVVDVATALMMEADKQVEIKTIGRRPGEKLTEARLADYELPRYVLRNYPLILPAFNPTPWGKDVRLKEVRPQEYHLSPSVILDMIREKAE